VPVRARTAADHGRRYRQPGGQKTPVSELVIGLAAAGGDSFGDNTGYLIGRRCPLAAGGAQGFSTGNGCGLIEVGEAVLRTGTEPKRLFFGRFPLGDAGVGVRLARPAPTRNGRVLLDVFFCFGTRSEGLLGARTIIGLIALLPRPTSAGPKTQRRFENVTAIFGSSAAGLRDRRRA